MEIIKKYFPELSDTQMQQFAQLQSLYGEWNEKINVISRKDVDNIYERHVLHSLAIAKYAQFKDGSKILDLGTGGGFPAIPLAIFFPEIEILAVDSIAKKLKVVDEVAAGLGLKNIQTKHIRVEEIKEQYDFVVSRAVAPLTDLIRWTKNLYHPIQFNKLNNGLITLKGGDLSAEIAESKRKVIVKPLSDYFKEEFFETKVIAYISMIK
ncbi:MAG: 16S rRNA (guanine(527)-N(7))-methyltransferase RsmG [Chitinophagales bacterium]|nr:16S rRNA (guanine(527)-N(7))-methyltransferase RsmG [Chitinophagales bacterium]